MWINDARDSTTPLARLEERVNGEAEARSNLAGRVYRAEDRIEMLRVKASELDRVALIQGTDIKELAGGLAKVAGGLIETLERTDRIAQSMSALAVSHVELMRTVAALQRPSLGRRILARARTYVGKT